MFATATNQQIQNAMQLLADEPIFDKSQLLKITADFEQISGLLYAAVQQLELDLSSKQYWQLIKYLDTLLMWSKAYNLTAITQPVEALVKHVIDCLAIIPLLQDLPQEDLLDIGTGAGLPAIIIAICQPQRMCTPLDSNQKKIRFIRQVVSEIGLTNVKPTASRIQAYENKHTLITSRAFASLEDFICLAATKLADTGCLVAMKGKAPAINEIEGLSKYWLIEVKPLTVPYLSDARHLVILKKK